MTHFMIRAYLDLVHPLDVKTSTAATETAYLLRSIFDQGNTLLLFEKIRELPVDTLGQHETSQFHYRELNFLPRYLVGLVGSLILKLFLENHKKKDSYIS